MGVNLTPLSLLGMAASVFLAVGCSQAPPEEEPLYRMDGEAFGTAWHLTWRGPSPDVVEIEVEAVLKRVDAGMSSWRADSEISEIRRSDGPVVVSEETAGVIEAALSLASASDGAFDPTVEPLMELWGFRGERLTVEPTQEAIDVARALVGFQRVEVFRHGGVPLVNGAGTALDLSAIAKGYAVDAVSQTLSRLGAADHLVEIGGEVRVAGHGPSGLWTLSIDGPDPTAAPGEHALSVLSLTNAAVASSGDYRSGYDAGESHITHTMDPRTGRPTTSLVLATTVVAPDCATADGWATALMVLDIESGLAAIEARPELEALWVVGGHEPPLIMRSSGMDHVTISVPR